MFTCKKLKMMPRQTILVFLHDMISNVLHDRVHLKMN